MNRTWAGPGAGREGTGKRRVNTAATKARETHTNSIPIITADHGQVLAKTGREHIQDTRTQQPHCQFDRTQLYKFVKTPERESLQTETRIFTVITHSKKIYILSLLNCMLFQTCMTFSSMEDLKHDKSYGPQIILLLCFWSFYSLTTQIPIYLLSIYHMENGQYIMQHFSCCGKMKEESHMGFKQYEVE